MLRHQLLIIIIIIIIFQMYIQFTDHSSFHHFHQDSLCYHHIDDNQQCIDQTYI